MTSYRRQGDVPPSPQLREVAQALLPVPRNPRQALSRTGKSACATYFASFLCSVVQTDTAVFGSTALSPSSMC
jgi:hypothetical protein